MGVTTTQLQAVSKFTYGGVTHHVERVTEDVTLSRVGEGTDAFRLHRFAIDSYIEGSDLADLKTKLDAAITNLAKSNQDFALYRGATKVREILAADAHHGPVASVALNRQPDAGTLQGITVTVEASVPVTITAGLISHVYREATTVDEDGNTTQIQRTGEVTTANGTSAKTWIEGNLPGETAGLIRQVRIDTDVTDTSATYVITDSESPYRNAVPNTVKSHTYTDTTVTESGTVTRKVRSGQVETISPTNASTWINANLPTLDPGFERTIEIDLLDTTLEATYTVTDVNPGSEWSPPPGIDQGQIDVRTALDSQRGKTVVTSGYLIGSSAQTEVDSIRSGLTNIIRDEVKINTLGDGRVDFSFTQLLAENDDDFLSWQESIRVSGGGVAKEVVLHPDRAPFVIDGVQLPWVITVNGSAQGLGKYVKPAGVLLSYQEFLDGEPDVHLRRDDDDVRTTTWSQRYVLPYDPGTVKPSDPVIDFIP